MSYPSVANTHLQFLQMEFNVSLNKTQSKKLTSSRKAIESSIKNHFRSHHSGLVPKFWIQGSAKMGTMILDKDDTYDVDLGVYFLEKPDVNPETLQGWVYDAVASQTSVGTQRRKKCIRVIYKNQFDVDLPVYYKRPNDKAPFLATKNGWEKSDPRELFEWFKSKTDKNGQLKRIVKYFKAWARYSAKKMPSGIAFTVWAATHFVPHERDDVAFYETAKAMRWDLFWQPDIICRNPATPGDNLVSKLNYNQKENFREEFKKLISDAKLALNQPSNLLAVEMWRQQFGNVF